MADDIRIEITGDSSDIKKVVKTAEKLVKRFEKANSKSTQRRVRKQEVAAKKIARAEERKSRHIAAMERRLSRKRARNRLRLMRENIRVAKREALEEERIRKKNFQRITKFAKFGAAGLGIGAGLGIIAGGRKVLTGIAKYEIGLRRLALNAKLTKKQEMALGESIDQVAMSTGADRDIMMEVISTVQKGSGTVLSSVKDITKVGKLLRILGEESAQGIGETIAALHLNLGDVIKRLGGDFMPLLEDMIVVGNAGNFTLEEMADSGEKVGAEFIGMMPVTRQMWKNFQAIAQVFKSVTGTADAATEKMKQFRTLIKTPTKVALMEKAGIVMRDVNGQLLTADQMLKNIIDWMTEGGDITKLGIGEIGIFLDTLKTKQQTYNMLLERAKDTTGEMNRQFSGVQDTVDATLSIMGQLTKVLSQKVFKDFFKELSKGLNEFLGNKERMEAFVEDVKALAEALGMAAGYIVKFARRFTETKAKREHEKRLHGLLTKEFRSERNRLIAEARKVAPDISSPEYQKELRRLTADFYIENNLTFDETGKVKKQDTNIKNLNNSDLGIKSTTKLSKTGVGLIPE